MLCEFCETEDAHNFHHLIPRTLHSNKWFRKMFSRAEMARGIDVCGLCHRTIHDLIPDAKRLGKQYNSLDKLLDHAELSKYAAWKRSRGPQRGKRA